MRKEVTNVECPPPNPKETNRIFEELSKRPNWSIYGPPRDTGSIVPPGGPPPVQPPTEKEKPDPDEEPTPLPVAEISLSEMQEHVVKEEILQCWRCGTKDGIHKLENGAVLCTPCEQILKP